jgi:hypothetical protein
MEHAAWNAKAGVGGTSEGLFDFAGYQRNEASEAMRHATQRTQWLDNEHMFNLAMSKREQGQALLKPSVTLVGNKWVHISAPSFVPGATSVPTALVTATKSVRGPYSSNVTTWTADVDVHLDCSFSSFSADLCEYEYRLVVVSAAEALAAINPAAQSAASPGSSVHIIDPNYGWATVPRYTTGFTLRSLPPVALPRTLPPSTLNAHPFGRYRLEVRLAEMGVCDSCGLRGGVDGVEVPVAAVEIVVLTPSKEEEAAITKAKEEASAAVAAAAKAAAADQVAKATPDGEMGTTSAMSASDAPAESASQEQQQTGGGSKSESKQEQEDEEGPSVSKIVGGVLGGLVLLVLLGCVLVHLLRRMRQIKYRGFMNITFDDEGDALEMPSFDSFKGDDHFVLCLYSASRGAPHMQCFATSVTFGLCDLTL